MTTSKPKNVSPASQTGLSWDQRLDHSQGEIYAVLKELEQQLSVVQTRQRGSLNRNLHRARQMCTPHYHYVSQAGQDAVLDRIFKGKTHGTFLDIGGYDGLTGSNTFFFEKYRQWTGVLVEPVTQQLEKAKAIRSCPCLGLAIADSDGSAEFIAIKNGFTQMSGLSQSYDNALLEQVRSDPRHQEDVINVTTQTLPSVLKQNNLDHPDFISLDIEGGELSVLQSFPFERHKVKAWAIENNAQTSDISSLMRGHNYDLVEFCGPDELYVLKET